MGTKEKPIRNSLGYSRYCIAFQVVAGPNDFGAIDTPFATKAQIAKWIQERYIPCVDGLEEWKKEGPHLNSENWYNEITHVSEILNQDNICEMLRNGFCMKPNKFADNIPKLFKMSKACVYAMYPRGELTTEFIEKFTLQKVHLMPEDFAMVPPEKEGIKKYLSPLKTPAKNTLAAATTDPKVQNSAKDANPITPATSQKPPEDSPTIAAAAGAKKKLNMEESKGATKTATAAAAATPEVLSTGHQGHNDLEDTDDESVGRQHKKQKVGTKTRGLEDDTLVIDDSDDDKDSILNVTSEDQQAHGGHSLDVQNLQQDSQEEEDNQQTKEHQIDQQTDNEESEFE